MVSYQLLALAMADEAATQRFTDWDGDDDSRPGIPLFSCAKWFRSREDFKGRVRFARGLPLEPDSRLADAAGPYWLVQLLDADQQELIRFHGVAWGYIGEGPRMLACILSDALPGTFQSFDAAAVWVQSIPKGQAWEDR